MNKLYEMTIDDQLTDGIFAISLVDSPAIQEDYVLLSKDQKLRIEVKLEKLVDEKRKVVSGPILIPDLIIPRNGIEGPYDIVFRKDTIRQLSEKFMIDNAMHNVTLQHQVSVNKVYMVESWIVEDSKTDKSAFLGYNLPVGSWFGTYKIADEALWTEYVDSGVLRGFSIEGNFSQNEVTMCEHTHEELSEEDRQVLEVYLLLNYSVKDLDSYYEWKLGSEEANHPNCPSCIAFNGKIKKLRDWIATAIPSVKEGMTIAGLTTSYPYSPYGTFCAHNCNCELVKVADTIKIKNPFDKWKK